MSSSPQKHHPTLCSEQLMLTPSLAHRCNRSQSRFHAPAALSHSRSQNSRAGRGDTHCVSAIASREGDGELRGSGRWQSASSAALYHLEITGGPASHQPPSLPSSPACSFSQRLCLLHSVPRTVTQGMMLAIASMQRSRWIRTWCCAGWPPASGILFGFR